MRFQPLPHLQLPLPSPLRQTWTLWATSSGQPYGQVIRAIGRASERALSWQRGGNVGFTCTVR
jgi:hypothetical protein